MGFRYLNGKRWSEVTREECCHRSHRDPVPPGSPGPGSELMVG